MRLSEKSHSIWKREKRLTFDGGCAPGFLNPRTLVRTWGTRPELVVGERGLSRPLPAPKMQKRSGIFLISSADDRPVLVNLEENDNQGEEGE
jgi:hypothetical protein